MEMNEAATEMAPEVEELDEANTQEMLAKVAEAGLPAVQPSLDVKVTVQLTTTPELVADLLGRLTPAERDQVLAPYLLDGEEIGEEADDDGLGSDAADDGEASETDPTPESADSDADEGEDGSD
jgi:hypothetical protein